MPLALSNLVQLPGLYKLNEQKVDETIYLHESLSSLQNIAWIGGKLDLNYIF